MPRKSSYERLVGGIQRTKKQATKLATKHQVEVDACNAISGELSRLEEIIFQHGPQSLTPPELDELTREYSVEFKRIKADWKAVKARTKPILKQAREDNKREKARNKEILDTCRLSEFPNRAELSIIVDGWNVMGALLKGRGRSKSKMQSFLNTFAAHPFVSHGRHSLVVMFDGGGRDGVDGLVFVRHSGPSRIVDDVLVEEFTVLAGSPSFDGQQHVVVTSDRELTLRLHAIGVQVMKSGTFVRLVNGLLNAEADVDGDILMDNSVVPDENEDEESSVSVSSVESD
jgi:transposase